MGGITPSTKVGGQDQFEERLYKVISFLGHSLGFGIFAFTVALLAIEVILNPIFLFAQAESSGVDTGTPLTSFSWWIVIIITFSTTGIQYALLAPGARRGGIGRTFGWTIAGLDTLMDGGGFMAWLNGGDFWKFNGDTSDLWLGIFPSLDATWPYWVAYFVIGGVCLLHEPFLEMMLGRLTFQPAPDASIFAVNISAWTERAGKVLSNVKLIAIGLAPYVMLTLDMLLFPQSVKGQPGMIQVVFFIVTVVITLMAIMAWEYYNHLREEGNYKLKDLDVKHKAVFLGALIIVVIDSFFDLMGFNRIIFGVASPLPPTAQVAVPFLLTAGLVMLMTTTFEPLNAHLFAPLARMGAISDGGMGDDIPPMGDPGMMGGMGSRDGMGDMPPFDDDNFDGFGA